MHMRTRAHASHVCSLSLFPATDIHLPVLQVRRLAAEAAFKARLESAEKESAVARERACVPGRRVRRRVRAEGEGGPSKAARLPLH